MTYTIFTFLTASLQVAIICIIVNHWLEKRLVNVQCLSSILFLAACLPFVRLIFPLEFSFTYEIKSANIYPSINEFFKANFFWFPISRIQFIYLAWAVTSCAIILVKIANHLKFVKCFTVIPSSHGEYSDILGDLAFTHTRKVDIKKTTLIHEPMIFGVFKPTILLPNNHALNRDDLRFVLKHELGHLYHHDLFVKWLLEILCSIYWWIPPAKQLKNYVYFIMELRADDFVIANEEVDIRAEYLSSMLRVCRSKDSINESILATPFCYYGDAGSLSRRFRKISIRTDDRDRTISNSIYITVLSLVFLLLSYSVVIQPDYRNSQLHQHTAFEISEDKYYIVPLHDGGFELYREGLLIAHFDELDEELGKLPIKK